MTTSDLLSRMYAPPLKALSDQSTRLMQKLHTMPESVTTATSAQKGRSCTASVVTSTSCIAPYLHRVYWLLTNPDGHYLAAVCGTTLQWVADANAVPPELRFTTQYAVKHRWWALQSWLGSDKAGFTIQPVDFYAHRDTPHLWCTAHD